MELFVRTIIALSIASIAIQQTNAAAPTLGTADSFAVLAGSTVTNTGPSLVTGNVGVSPGSAMTGMAPGMVVAPYTIHAGDAVAAQAEADTLTAYNVLKGLPFTTDLTGQNMGGLTLSPGVFHFDSSAQLTGALVLDGKGNCNSDFIFQISSTLTTTSNSSIILINGADADDVFFQVGSSATLGMGTAFQGNILALTSITLNTGTTILDGRALAINGAVTMDTNTITIPSNVPCTAVPEPSSVAVIALGFLALVGLLLRARKLHSLPRLQS